MCNLATVAPDPAKQLFLLATSYVLPQSLRSYPCNLWADHSKPDGRCASRTNPVEHLTSHWQLVSQYQAVSPPQASAMGGPGCP